MSVKRKLRPIDMKEAERRSVEERDGFERKWMRYNYTAIMGTGQNRPSGQTH